ncbi:bdbA [Symbiodinium necroappetens]|nr:bdbA [Symbiodinium sp. KB8]CAE7406651.1 bdbA [Symbiodinium necroappetens]CAE7868761.1 bdbA [Symbiodinium microadriaticum]
MLPWLAVLLPLCLLGKKQLPVTLTAGNPDGRKGEKAFLETINGTKSVVVSFTSLRTSCKPCSELQPEFKKAAKKLKKKGFLCGVVDTDLAVNVNLKDVHNVTSIPSMHLFRKGQALSKLEGFQSSASIEQWVAAVDIPQVEVFETQASFDKAVRSRKWTETMFAATGGPMLQDLMDSAAVKGHSDGWASRMRFLFWSDGGRGRPFGAVYRGVNEMEHFDASGQVSTEMLEEFLKTEHLPLFGMATMDDLASVFGKGSKGNVFVCFDPEAFETQAKKYARAFQKVAKKWKSYGFVFFNVRDPVAKLLQMDCKEFPSVTLKLLAKPFRTFTKSFAKEEPTEKVLAQFMKESIESNRQASSEL